ncbi:MAG: carboxypeptidase-like regulatory domain-containing protein, partial [Bryobacteraceae bacterium]
MKLQTAVVVLLSLASAVLAQTPSATVVGRVTDPAGAVIPNVTVKVTNVDTNISQHATSSDVGDYTVLYLNPGRYSLEAKSEGFRTYRRAEFTL